MNLDLDAPGMAAACERLAPFARRLLAAAADRALAIHADEVTPEHLLVAALENEDSAAHSVVLHAFADPETLAVETLATAPGILIVGSERTIPFSVLGVAALEAARDAARSDGCDEVGPAHLLRGTVLALPEPLRADLVAAGYTGPEPEPATPGGPGALDADGPLFRHFQPSARRVLVLAGKAATRLGRDSVGPAHLLLASLEADALLAGRAGVSASAARRAIAGRDEDTTPVVPRTLPPGEELLPLLAPLPPGADSVDLLGAYLERGAPEIRELFRRHRVTGELVEKARGAFRDPSA